MKAGRVVSRWGQRGLAIALIIGIVSLLAASAITATEALEEHKSAIDATDLRLAVLTVSSTTDIGVLSPAGRELFEESLVTLDDHDEALPLALHSVADSERDAVRAALADLVAHGRLVAAGGPDAVLNHGIAEHDELQERLRRASLESADAASRNERRALVGALGALAMFATLILIAVRSRARAQTAQVTANAYRDAASRFGALLDQLPDATAVISPDGTFSYSSAALSELLGGEPKTLADLVDFAVDSERDDLAELLQRVDAHETSLDIHSVVIDDGSGAAREFCVWVTDLRDDPVVRGHLVSLSETTTDNQARRQLEYLATHDQLTGLANRRQLMRDIDRDDAHALLMLDLDSFKEINDTHGHHAGDELLRIVAGRFESRLRAADEHLYRLGGDEFAVITDADPEAALALGQAIVDALEEPVQLSTGFERASVSVGVSHRDVGNSQLSLLRRADIALYEAKAHGGGHVEMLSDELEREAVRLSDIGRALESAELDVEFRVEYQPIVAASDEQPHHVEALLRWTSRSQGPVPPDVFIPLAESSGRIIEIGYWVLDQALAALASWRAAGLPHDLGMTVNVSPYQLIEDGFVDQARRLLAHHDIEASGLTIELTESALATSDPGIVDRLHELRDLGCSIACDDFGSGYSNLGQLMAMPINIIKVDRKLLMTLSEMREQFGGSTEQPCQVMSAIASIGDAIDATLIAEGVETQQQATSLRLSGVHFLQGYRFGAPQPGAIVGRELVARLARRTPRIDSAEGRCEVA